MARRGFTLLEAMTVVAVVAVLTALAVQSWNAAIARARANDAVTGVYGQLLAARKIARTHNQPVRLGMVLDGGVALARWERLPCDNEVFGLGCPSAGCATTDLCGSGSCPCRETGAWVSVPATVDLSAWAGLCFRGGTGQAVPRVAGVGDCLAPPPAGALSLRAGIAHQDDQQLYLEPLNGQPRLLACGAGDAGCH
ncbi:MAG TPA: prepilin-type N-terminal cleavage/methylation domain-containing protein [Myxococcaceae bacterium]|nr:prepilin-type N-terminal cleavage/methylation domain-containing protein [Myxococcaceae bacterium]